MSKPMFKGAAAIVLLALAIGVRAAEQVQLSCQNTAGEAALSLLVTPNVYSVVEDQVGISYQVSWNPDFIIVYFRADRSDGASNNNYLKIDSVTLKYTGQRQWGAMIQPISVKGVCQIDRVK